ncbi:DUF4286 family protein [Paludibacter sp. 221]|uniref:DUF4286 family protein n=1 Tax=Paludibacter sp. 221 TaxID=2302939 RepID=UPI0013CF6190|nr:DUF4286 family protein [Paludibacter sp. 221]NDV46625.1 DUF4286 family protein [Paludibacter sp. 221]
MLIFNTTYLVSDKSYGIWYKWLNEQHLPSMLESGFFSKPQVAKVLTNEPQEGTSYSVQFQIADMKSLELWNETYGESFLSSFSKQFGEDVLLFSTILELMQ